jgi:hypothetical protein
VYDAVFSRLIFFAMCLNPVFVFGEANGAVDELFLLFLLPAQH